MNFDTLQTILDDMTEVGEWQLEIRKHNDDPHDVDELILHVAPENGANVERLKEKSGLPQSTPGNSVVLPR